MDRWRRLAIAGSLGVTLLCFGLILTPTLYNLGTLSLARWRWARNGGLNYTVVVAQECMCLGGEYKLTVRNGQVITVETVGAVGPVTTGGPNPAGFSGFTVEATFERARRSVAASLWSLGQQQDHLDYDPVLGYVTRFESVEVAAPHLSFTYAARDLHLDPP